MTRRHSFLKTAVLAVTAFAVTTCKRIYGASSRWSWPGYPDENELRKHLRNSPKHPDITASNVNQMGFGELMAAHDRSHQKRGDSPRWSSPRNLPGSGSSKPSSAGYSRPSTSSRKSNRMSNPSKRRR